MIHQKKILVLESEKLLPASILSLLASRSEFDVTNTIDSTLSCIDEPGRPQPDVIILAEEQLAANISAVVKLAKRHPKLRLIVLGLNNTYVHIFDKQIIQVRQISDFLELL